VKNEFDLPPLQCSQGGFTYNGAHIEYWKERALKAEAAKPQSFDITAVIEAVQTVVGLIEQTSQMAYERLPQDFEQFGEPSYIKDGRRAVGTLAVALGLGPDSALTRPHRGVGDV
jgi:hypothetical protein